MKDILNQISDPNADVLYAYIIQVIKQTADPAHAHQQKRWSKNEDFRAHGVPGEVYKTLLRQLKNPVKSLSFEERLDLARRLVSSQMNEQVGIANFILSISTEYLTQDHFDFLDHHVGCFCSWGATDSFCIDVLQPLLRKHPDEVLELLGRWNRSDNQWKRRASVVAFTRKIGASGTYTEQALSLCENLIWDKEYYVLKGVGWVLKDVMRADRAKVLDYVRDLRCRGASSIITLYAIKDLVGAEREEILAIKAGNTVEEN